MKPTDKQSGHNAGRQRRYADTKANLYPVAGLPEDAEDRSREYIEAYSLSYYTPKQRARPRLEQQKEMLSVRINPETLATARSLGINLSIACEQGLDNAIAKAKKNF
jgi:hypothetical protein